MRRLKRFARLSRSERSLFFRALLVVGVARASLWLLPLATARRIVMAAAAIAARPSPEQSVWAVRVAGRYVPGATCLTQALAVQALLARIGHESQVEIGVAKDAEKFEAHAWVS